MGLGLIKGMHMTRRFWLIVVLIASILPWPGSQQLYLLAFAPSSSYRLLGSSDDLLEGDVGNNNAWLDPQLSPSNDELMVFCEFEQELNEGESADGSAENQWATAWLDWEIDCTIAEHDSCMRHTSDRFRLNYPMMKSQIVCRC